LNSQMMNAVQEISDELSNGLASTNTISETINDAKDQVMESLTSLSHSGPVDPKSELLLTSGLNGNTVQVSMITAAELRPERIEAAIRFIKSHARWLEEN